ncbi:MAG: HD domain-containing protein [Lachnospiraceae bacterium]|nr:HD domain-containing protein [Lachnospiraceae bacterium]
MIHGQKIAALCVAEIQKDDIQSMIYPLNSLLKKNGWKTFIFSSCTDMYFDTPFDNGEAGIFRLLPYDLVEVVIIYARSMKKFSVIDDIVGWARQHGKPVIVIDDDERREGAIHVNFDESDAFRHLMIHLMEEHHVKKVNCISGIEGNYISDRRTGIYKEVLLQYGIPFEERRLGYGMFWGDATVKVMEEFLKDPEDLPEAIVCLNDTMAIIACDMLSERGISVPEDIIVTGFDGIEQEKYNVPRLSTCRRDMDKFADFVYDILEECSSGRETKEQYFFPYAFDPSESCGCEKTSVLKVNVKISDMYRRMDSSVQYDRSMTNMLTQLVKLDKLDEMFSTMKEFVREDVWFCFNTDFKLVSQKESDGQTVHLYETLPFTDSVYANRFFVAQDEILTDKIDRKELVPDWDMVSNRCEPVVFFCLHNQQEICGYASAFVQDDNYEQFGTCLQRIQKLVLNLDNAIGMYEQQRALRISNQKLINIQSQIIASFADLVESRDDSTGQHVKRTGEYFKILAGHLAKLPRYASMLTENELNLMYKAAPLHDIGKIKISDVILNKPGKLTPEEFEIIKTHTLEGNQIIIHTMANIEEDDYLKMAGEIALYHHEKWDGSGYPYRLAGEQIPLSARIMAVVDVFDALTSKRVYKDAYALDKAYDILQSSSGSHFDPDIIQVFMDNREEIEKVFMETMEAGRSNAAVV